MSRKLTLKIIGARDLGICHVNETSRNIDWRDVAQKGYDDDGESPWRVILPPITLGLIAERASHILDAKQAKAAARYPNREADEELTDAFRDTAGFGDWETDSEPMMNYLYPVMVRDYDGDSAEALAARLDEFAPSISLIELGSHNAFCDEEHAFALNGGGMNLSDQIAAAYLCAGHTPPAWVLDNLPGVISAWKLEQLAAPLKLAFRKAADTQKRAAARTTETRARLFAPKPAED